MESKLNALPQVTQDNQLNPATSQKIIHAFYHELLGREPDQAGLDSWSTILSSSGLDGVKNILNAFVNGEEFQTIHAASKQSNLENNLENNHLFDYDHLEEKTLQALFAKTASYWRNTASTPADLYWSVVTHSKFRGVLTEDIIGEFFETGRQDLYRVQSICKQIGVDLSDCKEYLEYGCGVGRLVVNLPSTIKRVNCVDFSFEHLKETGRNIEKRAGAKQFSLHQIDTIGDLQRLPNNQNIIHSFIVLQHNTPPVIEKTILDLLGLLAINGVAMLHVPIARAAYSFDPEEYLADPKAGTGMEMHILPRANLYKIARKAHCEIVYSICAGGCGGDIYSEIIAFKRVS